MALSHSNFVTIFSRRVHVTQATVDHLQGEFPTEPGNGQHSGSSQPKAKAEKTYFIVSDHCRKVVNFRFAHVFFFFGGRGGGGKVAFLQRGRTIFKPPNFDIYSGVEHVKPKIFDSLWSSLTGVLNLITLLENQTLFRFSRLLPRKQSCIENEHARKSF